MIDLPSFLKLAAVCAPSIAPETLSSVVSHESQFEPLAIHVNGDVSYHPATLEEAIELARGAIEMGESVDLGLGQINSRNLDALSLTLEQVFDPCLNLGASARLLEEGYRRSLSAGWVGQPALLHMLSTYNTGDLGRGFENGYVQKVVAAAEHVVPALSLAGADAAQGFEEPIAPPDEPRHAAHLVASGRASKASHIDDRSAAADWDVFAQADRPQPNGPVGVFVFR